MSSKFKPTSSSDSDTPEVDQSEEFEDMEEIEEPVYEIDGVANKTDELANPSGESSLEAKLRELEAALQKEKSDSLYARAEFENFRKRSVKERSDLLKYGGERVIVEVLTVMDNFDRAIQASEKSSDDVLRKGVVMIAEELRNTLKRLGVVEVPPENGKFDPTLFEGISTEPTDSVEPGQIARVFRPAYKLHDRVIRPGQVVIAVEKRTNDEKE